MSRSPTALRIGIVAGEMSGDLLGARLIKALKQHLPNAQFEGVGGPEMKAQGCKSLVPMERLSVLGLTEILGRYLELRRIRQRLAQHFLDNPPDVFIAVDSPGFNLGLEYKLRRAGIPTVHYVSPQVWAWRTYRVRKIRKAVDLMLALFPFEENFYRSHNVAAKYIGHPLADEIPMASQDSASLRQRLKLPTQGKLLALLPGSRVSELKAHAELFVKTVQHLHQQHPDWQFVMPFVNRQTRLIFEAAVKKHEAWDLPLIRMHGHSRDAMIAADLVVLASGTATLEALLLKRPMVVTYRVSRLSYYLIKFFSHIKLYSMPNNLAGRLLVPELLQYDAQPEKIASTAEALLEDPARIQAMLETFTDIHTQLRRDANTQAAAAVLDLLKRKAQESEQVAHG